jgi:hypothetical protein
MIAAAPEFFGYAVFLLREGAVSGSGVIPVGKVTYRV